MYTERFNPCLLANYRDTFQSTDLDETRSYIGSIIKPHNLKVLGRRQSLDVKVGRTCLGPMSFIYIHHGAEVTVSPGELETVFLLQVPINGQGTVRMGKSVRDFSGRMAYIVSPIYDLEMQYSRTCDHFIFTAEKARLELFLEQQLQRPLDKPLEFKPWVELSQQRNRELVELIMHIGRQLHRPTASLQHAILQPQVESLLLSAMLINLEHNYYAELTTELATPKPYYIKKAQAYIVEHAEHNLTPWDVAQASCISLRSLYAGFKTYLHCTPMEYIRNTKLTKIRAELERHDAPAISIAAVTSKYGISHFGHFAASYRRMFGELPRDTLRGRQPHSTRSL